MVFVFFLLDCLEMGQSLWFVMMLQRLCCKCSVKMLNSTDYDG